MKVDPGSEARSRHSALTIALTGAAASSSAVAGLAAPDFHFAVPSHDPCIVQETHGMVLLSTGIGGSRVLDMFVGDPLPRIC